MTDPTTITVSAEPLREILQALIGPGHLIRELQALQRLPDSPITKLVSEYNAWATAQNETSEATND